MAALTLDGNPEQPLIELVSVSKYFKLEKERNRSMQDVFIRLWRRQRAPADEFWPLRDVSFTVARGDSIGILGQNGSGKSTLLKILTGVLPPTTGRVHVYGRIAALLELGAGFHPELTGRENIFLNGSVHGLGRREMRRKLDSIIDFAEIGEFIDVPVKHYSSGMYVRLGFSVAIHTEPDILVVDEVLTVGDQIFQQKCMERIWEMKNAGVAIVLVSHNLEDIRRLCTRAIWLQDGLPRANGPAMDVVDAYLMYSNELYYAQRHARLQEEKEEDAAAEAETAPASNPKRWGTQDAEIVQVELLDAHGTPRENFHQGDSLCVRIHYRTHQRIATPAFGLAIYRNDGVHINGPNSVMSGYPIAAIDGAGIVDYVIDELPLNPGAFELTVAIYNRDSTVAIDHHHRMYTFHVTPTSVHREEGVVHLPAAWRHQALQPALHA